LVICKVKSQELKVFPDFKGWASAEIRSGTLLPISMVSVCS